ncbi:MAG: PhoH family protein [Cytophagales bacterium]|nr:MAG: PhoH family protein [Cytophagales bacterium]
MIEKVIQLEEISLVDFLGVENSNIKKINAAFPQSKVTSRGNELFIQGSSPEIQKIQEIIHSLLLHYQKFGRVTQENVQDYIQQMQLSDEPLQIPDLDMVLVHGIHGQPIKPKTENHLKLIKNCQENDLVFAIGPAGTGKTYISVALAVRALKNKEVKKIVITRPAVEAGENLGFLPGDLKEKIDPYLRPIYDALDDMIAPEKLKTYIEQRTIEIAPLAYMRGRTLSNAFVLLDEAQNTTPMQMKMFLTRMGMNSKMIITGDKSQIDLPPRQKSGLLEALRILQNVEGIGFVELDGRDVLRHRLVRNIVRAYDKVEKEKENQQQ